MTTGHLGTVDNPEVLPYYMEAVERGWAGTRKRGPRNNPERGGDDVPCEISDRDSGDPKEHDGSGDASGGVPHVEVDYPFSADCINYN